MLRLTEPWTAVSSPLYFRKLQCQVEIGSAANRVTFFVVSMLLD